MRGPGSVYHPAPLDPRWPRKWRQFHRSQPRREPRNPDVVGLPLHSAGPPQEATKVATVAQFAAPQGTARFRRGPFTTTLRPLDPQKATKVATVAQFAAPPGSRE
eukprot:9037795-Pyramimonas_sp.AAC.1